MKRIAYTRQLPYRLDAEYAYRLPPPPLEAGVPFVISCDDDIILDCAGRLQIAKGYEWDGPSGPAFDTEDFMRASLVHDALYQLMREGLLPLSYRKQADKALRDICREDGMSWPRAQYVYRALRWFGEPYAKEGESK